MATLDELKALIAVASPNVSYSEPTPSAKFTSPVIHELHCLSFDGPTSRIQLIRVFDLGGPGETAVAEVSAALGENALNALMTWLRDAARPWERLWKVREINADERAAIVTVVQGGAVLTYFVEHAGGANFTATQLTNVDAEL